MATTYFTLDASVDAAAGRSSVDGKLSSRSSNNLALLDAIFEGLSKLTFPISHLPKREESK